MDIPLPESWAEAAPQLLPVLRRRTEPAHARRAAHRDADSALLRRPFAPHLHQLVVLDLPDLMLYLNRGHLARWGADEDAAFGAALDNLQPHATAGLRARPEWGLWQLESGDGYEASRLLLPGWLGAFRGMVPGRPVAAIPASRILLIGGDEDPAQVATLLDVGDRAFRGAGGPLSPTLYTLDDRGAVVPWVPPADHPEAARAAGNARMLATYEYAEQESQLLADDDIADAVVPCSLVRRRDTGEAWTVARWERTDGAALLPEADRVVLVDGDTERELSWAELRAATSLAPTDHDPPRFRAHWPGPA